VVIYIYTAKWNIEECGFLGCNTVRFRGSPTFRRNISPQTSGWKSKPSEKQAKTGGNLSWRWMAMFPRNVGLPPNYKALQFIRPYYSDNTSICIMLCWCIIDKSQKHKKKTQAIEEIRVFDSQLV
jgi:hypothetical protein